MGIDNAERISALLTEIQAARLLCIQPATLASWRLHGRVDLPFVRVGRCIRYRHSDITNFIEHNTKHGGTPSFEQEQA